MTKYESLALKLTEQIERNLQNGISKLPTEAELCSRYQISRQTVRAALALLSRQGIIVSRQGSGSYATGLSPDSLRNTIPILITSSQEYIYPHLIADIRSALSGQGYALSVYPTGNDTSKEREHLLKFLDAPPRGMIVEGCKSTLPNPNTDLYERLRASGTFILFLHNSYNGLEDNVCIKDDNYYGGCLLAEYLTALGHTRIAALFKMDDMQGPERYHGVSARLRDLGCILADRHTGWYLSSDLDALEKKQDTRFITNFIQNQLKGCSAVICHDDEIAYWMIKELSYASIHVPQELSVVCFGNSYLNDLSGVRITSLTHASGEMADALAECISQKLRGLSVVSQDIPWQLVHRESAAAFNPTL